MRKWAWKLVVYWLPRYLWGLYDRHLAQATDGAAYMQKVKAVSITCTVTASVFRFNQSNVFIEYFEDGKQWWGSSTYGSRGQKSHKNSRIKKWQCFSIWIKRRITLSWSPCPKLMNWSANWLISRRPFQTNFGTYYLLFCRARHTLLYGWVQKMKYILSN